MRYLLIIVMVWTTAFADDFDDATDAYIEKRYAEALNGFYLLAKEGDSKAQFNVGLMYAKGEGAKQDLPQAQRWYERAAKQDNKIAQFNLGQMYSEKAKIDKNLYKKAIFWYDKSAKLGFTQAYNNLAALYLEGLGVEEDEKRALELFDKAAKKGNNSARVNAAVLYAWGESVEHNKMKAFEYLKKALRSGQNEASGYLDKLCKESSWVCVD